MLKVANSVISASRITGVLPVANGGTNASTASITSFNNITGFTASGTTGTTSTKLVFDTTPTLVGDVTLSTGNLVIGTSGKGVTDSTGANTLNFTSTETTANKRFTAANFRTLSNSGSIPAVSTATVLTLSATALGVYIVQANFGAQGSEIYTGALIVAANAGSFRVITNGSGTNSAMTLSGANVQLANAIGSALDFTASAILIAS